MQGLIEDDIGLKCPNKRNHAPKIFNKFKRTAPYGYQTARSALVANSARRRQPLGKIDLISEMHQPGFGSDYSYA